MKWHISFSASSINLLFYFFFSYFSHKSQRFRMEIAMFLCVYTWFYMHICDGNTFNQQESCYTKCQAHEMWMLLLNHIQIHTQPNNFAKNQNKVRELMLFNINFSLHRINCQTICTLFPHTKFSWRNIERNVQHSKLQLWQTSTVTQVIQQ